MSGGNQTDRGLQCQAGKDFVILRKTSDELIGTGKCVLQILQIGITLWLKVPTMFCPEPGKLQNAFIGL